MDKITTDLAEALGMLLDRLDEHGSIDPVREEGPVEDARQALESFSVAAKQQRAVVREFFVMSESWYGAANLPPAGNVADEIAVIVGPEEGQRSEFLFRWTKSPSGAFPGLSMYYDSWGVAHLIADVFEKLRGFDGEVASAQEVAQILLDCGFVDKTERTKPKGHGF